MEKPFARFHHRFAAHFIDAFATGFAAVIGAFAAGFLLGITGHAPGENGAQLKEAAAMGYYFWAFVGVFLNSGVLQGLTGATIGKSLVGIRVVRVTDGSAPGVLRSLGRSMATLISALPLYVGYLTALVTKDHRTWHDYIAGTVVIRKDATYPERPLSLGGTKPLPMRDSNDYSFPNAA